MKVEPQVWYLVGMDLIGPYKIRRKGKENLVCKCVTMIDPATGWFEIHQYDDKRSITVANIVEQEWFNRYPWPTQVTFDRGSEFIGQDFKGMIQDDYGVKAKPITVRNPQANSVVERIHQVIANMIRTFELEDNYLDEDDPWKGILSATAFAVRSTIHTTTQKTPGQLVFGRDIIFNTVGTENKYENPYEGPYPILQVNDNGTVKLKVKHVTDSYNVRRLTPYTDNDHGGECNM